MSPSESHMDKEIQKERQIIFFCLKERQCVLERQRERIGKKQRYKYKELKGEKSKV